MVFSVKVCLLMIASVLATSRLDARPIITQDPEPQDKENDPPSDQFWTLDPVPGQPNHWVITLREHPQPSVCANICSTLFTIERVHPSEIVIIDSLEIQRPQFNNRGIGVTLGENSPSARIRSIASIAGDPWEAGTMEGTP